MSPEPRNIRRQPPARLRFTPYAWAKFHWFCHRGPSEIGAFGISDPEDLLLMVDIAIVEQSAHVAGVVFDDEAVADHFDLQVDLGRRPEQFARTWLHTHPGDSPQPSGVDEQTFARVFGSCDWAVMAILARGGETYARLRFNTGPGGQLLIPVAVDWTEPFTGSEHEDWDRLYQTKVAVESLRSMVKDKTAFPFVDLDGGTFNDDEPFYDPWNIEDEEIDL